MANTQTVASTVPTAAEIEAKIHTDARDARVAKVKAEIAASTVSREKTEKETGLVEGPGAKADRKSAEAIKLAQANELRVVELIEGSGTSALDNAIIATVNAIANNINGRKS